MTTQLKHVFENIMELKNQWYLEEQQEYLDSPLHKARSFESKLGDYSKNLPPQIQSRVMSEFFSHGPLEALISDPEVTEILVNQYDQVFYESNSQLHIHGDHFFSEQTYQSFLERLSQQCQTYLCREKPFIEAHVKNLRVTIVYSEISNGQSVLSIRKQPTSKWTLERLHQQSFLSASQKEWLSSTLINKENFLVIGGTGSGKTSLLQACLEELGDLERIVLIEDTKELSTPNKVSVSLLSRQDPSQSAPDVTFDDLLKRALRLRPDRLVVGEVRGSEAKSLLLALATGHEGSFSSLHAKTAEEALLRLEMLIQMGAPQWNLESIRKLIFMTLKYILMVKKTSSGRRLVEIHQLCSVEHQGITLSEVCL